MNNVSCTSAHLSGQEKKIFKKRKRDLGRVFHLGMISKSIMNNGKEEPTRRASYRHVNNK